MTNVKDNQRKYYNAFNLVDGIGPLTFKKLLSYFSSLKEAWLADANQFIKAGLNNSLIEQIKIKRQKIDPDSEMGKLEKEGIDLITIEDKNYPKLLKEIYNPPACLYCRGKFDRSDEFSLGIVGARKLSSYGRQITPALTADLTRAGLTIVSGLAKGIDTLAHRAALLANGRTIAVLGSGPDKKSIYPRENQYLAEKISQQGIVLSEFPLGVSALAPHFPQRNRIISGLSLGVLIVEASKKSGALITAKEALEQNREVFAVPGPIFSQNSFGPNNLIKMGAKLVTEANDILEDLNLNLLTEIKRKDILADNQEESLILKQLSFEPLHIDKIIFQAKLPANIVNSLLTMMEIRGKVKNLGGNNYVLAR
ncbi:MAG: DNA protecting protein DprA [Candidatus Portnoybacteria bacterium RIFCSPLOWO2_12_FULL_39_9]|uniref:DNA protecting protein DprA n=1 Tax=Candidatus Portnoybacteria bacterium RIFCSPHIGHO2_12_FULL_38_9 TaxID=1801997 RepID=A0A1G2FIW0_9BACT|nr:MAG: DNA protecting protein DprA [Candidatus Portnoybacteria bacterium RIFCSPHIGHO2_02_FULL_39_12]OGZ37518.1 MAG: DNA protecting protein DprA [Candidatus Portnoybacteria bacterium RIFCSPHIGHO2_12_FULL_38_9]OGZ39362.1 MAG: DNA protecting protein DprA [Candidatus Portnoybacteria bacterium RIFCSPLOWO2_01_FULL_38_39]OGZ39858.1 MAG: DNA protecting protein DprA [Candidatus Portnoybacteria bacterium RIFCSPLOWO2_12_FULL_39_9]